MPPADQERPWLDDAAAEIEAAWASMPEWWRRAVEQEQEDRRDAR